MRGFLLSPAATLLLSLCMPVVMPAAPVDEAAIDRRVESLFAELTPREKIALLGGGSVFGTQAIARLAIPALRFADGPNGVRSNNDEPATAFPTGVGLAATWNPELIRKTGEAIGEEARLLGVNVLLGPNVNLQRTPLAGRNFEAYSEDPYLTGRIGSSFVAGVQSRGVGTAPKHFVGNEQELERLRSNSIIDERTLHEIYLAPFEMIVREAKPWTVMAAYNRVNGTYMTEHAPLLRGVLKGDWRFDGVVMSDWSAVHDSAPALNGGTDLEMPGPARWFGEQLAEAANAWQVEQHTIDDAARRMLRLIVRSGALDAPPPPSARRDSGSDRHQDAALAVAREAITLLKNEHELLPLERGRIRTLAVIGPNADIPLIQGGGSSAVVPSRLATPLDALRAGIGAGITLRVARGVDNDSVPPPADYRMLSTDPARRTPGLAVSYYTGTRIAGTPQYRGVETSFDKTMFASELTQMAGRWEGWFWPEQDGEHEFKLATRGEGRLLLDGKVVIDAEHGAPLPQLSDFQADGRTAKVTLRKGRGYRLRIDYVSLPISFHQMHFGVRLPPPSIDEAVEAARGADATLVFVGVSRTSESEGRDRTSLALAGQQNALVDAVRAANANTIVVLNNGAPLTLPWVDRVPAIVEAWLPGQQGAAALAQILFGEANPSGRLPFSFPRRLEDNPTALYYSAGRDAPYGEGVFIGYRYYEKKQLQTLFPFGHGLSYTRFEYSNLRIRQSAPAVEISVDVKNVGERAGAEVVQLYVGDEATRDVVRPVKELRAFDKPLLAPGETRRLRFTLAVRDLAYYDVHRHDFLATPGTYRIDIGSSSTDIRVTGRFQWTAPPEARLPTDRAGP